MDRGFFRLGSEHVRADPAVGSAKVGLVAAYIDGRSHFCGVPLNNPHKESEIFTRGLVTLARIQPRLEKIWNEADSAERGLSGHYRRRGGNFPRLAAHFNFSLSWKLSPEDAKNVIEILVNEIVEKLGVAVQYAIHIKDGRPDHAHLLISEREYDDEGFGKKCRALNGIAAREQAKVDGVACVVAAKGGRKKEISPFMEWVRSRAAELQMDRTGELLEHRSFARIGDDRVPTPYIPRVTVKTAAKRHQINNTPEVWRAERAEHMIQREMPITADSSVVAMPAWITEQNLLDAKDCSTRKRERYRGRIRELTYQNEVEQPSLDTVVKSIPAPALEANQVAEERGRRRRARYREKLSLAAYHHNDREPVVVHSHPEKQAVLVGLLSRHAEEQSAIDRKRRADRYRQRLHAVFPAKEVDDPSKSVSPIHGNDVVSPNTDPTPSTPPSSPSRTADVVPSTFREFWARELSFRQMRARDLRAQTDWDNRQLLANLKAATPRHRAIGAFYEHGFDRIKKMQKLVATWRDDCRELWERIVSATKGADEPLSEQITTRAQVACPLKSGPP